MPRRLRPGVQQEELARLQRVPMRVVVQGLAVHRGDDGEGGAPARGFGDLAHAGGDLRLAQAGPGHAHGRQMHLHGGGDGGFDLKPRRPPCGRSSYGLEEGQGGARGLLGGGIPSSSSRRRRFSGR